MKRRPWVVGRGSWVIGGMLIHVLLTGSVFGEPRTPNPESRTSVGVLVIAHGGSTRWNRAVRQTLKGSELALPAEAAFGMGMQVEEVQRFQQAVEKLEARGVGRIAVIPLLVSSHSEVYRQYEYLFGLRDRAEWPQAGPPLQVHVPVVMGQALDDDPVVAEIVLERARALGRHPSQETVVLVAHGPNDEADNAQWLASLRRVAQHLTQTGGFAQALSLTIRDDASHAVREDAKQALRQAVQDAGRQHQVLVVPVLMAQGGIEHKIPKLLKGLSYRYSGRTLLPHPKLAEWIAQQASRLAQPSPTRYALAPGEETNIVLK